MDLKLNWHEPKRLATLAERGLDFVDAAIVFAHISVEFEDARADYGEKRMIFFGYLHGRLLAIAYVQRGELRHIFSMRKANEREQNIFG